jgi:hypothetical protein
MLLVLIWSMALLGLSLVVGQAVVNRIRPSDFTERTFQALSAAEAGIDDYRARLVLNGDPAAVVSDAFNSWVPVPGGESQGEFTYTADDSESDAAGQIKVISTGRSGDATRTVVALIAKRTSLDYAYVSNLETEAPYRPGVYPSNGGSPLTPAQAMELCNRQWDQLGYTNLKASAPFYQGSGHRNSGLCTYEPIDEYQRWIGRAHTNDAWYFSLGETSVFSEVPTSSCSTGTLSNECPSAQRWIDPAEVPAIGNVSGARTNFTEFEILSPYESVAWNPTFESELEIPVAPDGLKDAAAEDGCLFTGPTRIRFFPDGKMAVTSPDTPTGSVNPFCLELGKDTYYASPAPISAATQPTHVLDYEGMKVAGFNGVLYVQDAPDVATAASCSEKSAGNQYPFVIPSPPLQYSDTRAYSGIGLDYPRTEGLWSSGDLKGFPVEGIGKSGKVEPWSTGQCLKGTAFVQGAYVGKLTLVADQDIAITGTLMDANVLNHLTPGSADPTVAEAEASTYGVPDPTVSNEQANALAVIPEYFLYTYMPEVELGGGGWDTNNMRDIILNFVAIVTNGCLATQSRPPSMGNMTFVGSLGQRFRCEINTGGATGYRYFVLKYDERLAHGIRPPNTSQLFDQEPWRIEQMYEVRPLGDTANAS